MSLQMDTTPKKHSMFADFSTPVKKAKITAVPTFNNIVNVRSYPIMIETNNTREDLNHFANLVWRRMRMTSRKAFGWISRTKGNIEVAFTNMTCTV